MNSASKFIELHCHIDGSIDCSIARRLAALQNIPLPASDAQLEQLLRVPEDCKDLNQFLSCFALPCSLLMTPEALSEAVVLILEKMKEQGVIYAELRFAPQLHCEKGMSQRDAIEAVLEGIRKAPIRANVILCCMRGQGNDDKNLETLRLCREYLREDGGVVALDLAGAEALFPTAGYASLFAQAKAAGIPFTIHAGEADGAASVALALQYGAARIGHGVRSFEDPALLELLASTGTPLEMCPNSNRLTNIFPNMADYPLMDYLAKGIAVTLNTDDPAIEGTSLPEEFHYMERLFGLTPQQERTLLANAVNAAFCSAATKAELRKELNLD